jgi:hypothetical protein
MATVLVMGLLLSLTICVDNKDREPTPYRGFAMPVMMYGLPLVLSRHVHDAAFRLRFRGGLRVGRFRSEDRAEEISDLAHLKSENPTERPAFKIDT